MRAIPLQNRRNHPFEQRLSFDGVRQHVRTAAELHPGGESRPSAPVEIEQHEGDPDAAVAGSAERGIDVGKYVLVQPTRRAAVIEENAGPSVAEHEPAHMPNAHCGEPVERDGQLSQSRSHAAIGAPGVRAKVDAVIHPRQVGPDREVWSALASAGKRGRLTGSREVAHRLRVTLTLVLALLLLWPRVMWRRLALVGLAVVLAVPPARYVFTRETVQVDRTTAAWKAREALIARAKVFVSDSPPVGPRELAHTMDSLSCDFIPKRTSGTTPKFDCRLANGKLVKIKYGWTRERHSEVAATRLLTALGFGADRMSIVRKVRCNGCPAWPFEFRVLAEQFLLTSLFERAIDHGRHRDFEWAAVEEKLEGRSVEVDSFKGWDWRELDLVTPAAGGASRAELDALRLMAIFLAHWDAKASNQRLMCLGQPERDKEGCDAPHLLLQDLGATFGPSKVEYEHWAALPIWTDAAACVVSMHDLPYHGAGFPTVHISDEGRLLLGRRLARLSAAHIQSLFEGARFPDPLSGVVPAADLSPWVGAFQWKVKQIVDRPHCPASS